MSNVIFPNFTAVNSTNAFNILWKLSRAMKKAGWIYKSSGNGSSKDTSGTASNDLWGGNTDPATDIYAGIGTVSTGGPQNLPAASINATNPQTAGFPTSGTILVATSANGWQTITYTGTTSTSFTGCSGGTGSIPAGSAIGNAAINMDTVAGWWNAQGPSTLKIPITTSAVPGINGYFMRGEIISQATTGAQGEIIGYIFDGYAVQGFLVVMPRVDGSGADPHGWDHTHLITGSISGANVTPSATVIEFVREIVFWKGITTNNATTYMQCVDQSSESAQRLSVLAGSAGCTGAVAPGGGGSGNAFPTAGTYTAGGTGGSLAGQEVFVNNVVLSNIGKSQIIAANATYSSNTSADGSFIVAVSRDISVVPGNYKTLWGYQRTDNQEDGDVDPYVFWTPSNDGDLASVTIAAGSNGATLPQATINVSSTGSFTNPGTMFVNSSNGPQYVTFTGTSGGNQFTGCSGGSGTLTTGNFVNPGPIPSAKLSTTNIIETNTNTLTTQWNAPGAGSYFFRMWRRRGFSTSDTGVNGMPALTAAGASQIAISNFHHAASYWDREKEAAAFSNVYMGDFIWAVSIGGGMKIRKGSLRWIRCTVSDANSTYGFNTKSWISISGVQNPTGLPQASLLIGPWDGYTTPTTY
jgi:hypothetical protein